MYNFLYNYIIKKTQKVVQCIVHFVQFYVQYFCKILYVFHILYIFTMLARPVQFPKYLTILLHIIIVHFFVRHWFADEVQVTSQGPGRGQPPGRARRRALRSESVAGPGLGPPLALTSSALLL